MSYIKAIFYIFLTIFIVSCNSSTTYRDSNSYTNQETDSKGSFTRVIGSDKQELSRGFVIDSQGSYYLLGEITLDRNRQYKSFFLNKMSSSGEPIWQKFYIVRGDENLITQNSALDIDKNNNIYVAGNYELITKSNTESGIFITKYDSDGNRLWFKKFQDKNAKLGTIKIGKNNKIYIVGNKLYSDINSSNKLEFHTSMYIHKYTLDGVNIAKNEFNKIKNDGSYHTLYNLTFDEENNIYVAGSYLSKALEQTGGDHDLYIAKLDQNLEIKWQKTLGAQNSQSYEEVKDIKILGDYIYIIGITTGDFDGLHTNIPRINYNSYGLYLKFTTDGDEIFRKQFTIKDTNTIPMKLLKNGNNTFTCLAFVGMYNLYKSSGKITNFKHYLSKITLNHYGDILSNTTLLSDSDDRYYFYNFDAKYSPDGRLITLSEKNKGGHFLLDENPKDNTDIDLFFKKW